MRTAQEMNDFFGPLAPGLHGVVFDENEQDRVVGHIDVTPPLIAGTGFRCSAIIESLEQALARPVVAANQASLWRCLRSAGLSTPVSGYGGLLAR